ncbi:hypothetical protein P691DRAFT_255130 [Macrolepiota fuliginosa MF-IS2]|uniref:Nephrocystin 3-like N-terminal domain-containing protein n=1 Tax=Macrolepiota fuliginosa MF-IS2 TaxID=1400762 RepID=A0A9P6BZQ6_9AGAR|nr:hypothetical protein P691DRAFT_255130 [Macrolepiota fuliginosa MF-IS2]
MLSNSSRFVMHNSNCNFVEQHAAEGGGLKILRDASLPKAVYDSTARESALYSILKTEYEGFVAEFVAWTHRGNVPVMRLNGPKSNLAQLCAEKSKESLAATFCFSRSHGTDDPSRFFTTLASQLAIHIPSHVEILNAKLRHNPDLVLKSLKVQFEELIAAPIKELLAKGVDLGPRRVIMVEGIDERASVHAHCEILHTILESAGALSFRWAVFSRPNSQLGALLKEKGLALESCWNVCHSIPNFPAGDGEFVLRVELI